MISREDSPYITGLMIPQRKRPAIAIKVPNTWPRELVPACLNDDRFTNTESFQPDEYDSMLALCSACPALHPCSRELAPDKRPRWQSGWAVMAGKINPKYVKRLSELC